MKTEVYSWRVSSDLKTGLEREARRRKISMSAALDLAARDWLQKSGEANQGDEEQRRLQRAASKWLGALDGGRWTLPMQGLSTVLTVKHDDFNTYRIDGRRKFRVLPVIRP